MLSILGFEARGDPSLVFITVMNSPGSPANATLADLLAAKHDNFDQLHPGGCLHRGGCPLNASENFTFPCGRIKLMI